MTRYIGKQPAFGNFVKLDAITVVNGQASYTMQSGSSNFTNYDSVNQFIVSLNGVIQAPTDSFTVSGSTITFASALSTGDVINFILVLGDVLSIGTPSDNTVSTAKIQNTAVNADKLATDSVIEAKIQNNAVTTDKINNDAVTTDKVNLISTSSTPSLEAKGTSGQTDGYIQLNCEQNSHGIKLKSPPHSAGQSYTLTFPSTAPATDKILQTNSSGVLSFVDAPSGSHSLLSTATISSGTSSVVFDSSVITSTYKRYMVDFIDIYCGSSALLQWNVSDDNGSTYKTSSNHVYAVHGYESSSNGQNTSSTGDSRFVLVSQDHSANALRPMSLRMIVQAGKISSSRNVYINYYTFGICHDNEHAVAFNGAGYFASGEDKTFNNYKFFPHSGTFEGGLIKVYGIA